MGTRILIAWTVTIVSRLFLASPTCRRITLVKPLPSPLRIVLMILLGSFVAQSRLVTFQRTGIRPRLASAASTLSSIHPFGGRNNLEAPAGSSLEHLSSSSPILFAETLGRNA